MLSSKSNLLKSHRIVMQEEETRVIDYNDIIAERVAILSQNLRESIEGEDGDEFVDGFTDGLDATQVSALLDDNPGNVIKAEPVYDGPSPEELIAEANAQIEQMMSAAQVEAEQIKRQAYDEGNSQGYNDGLVRAQQELDAQVEDLNRQLAEQEDYLRGIYQQKISEIEPELVDVITNIYEHIFNLKLADERGLIMHLIGNALKKVEGSSEYLMHVSSDDLPFVSMQKETLLEECGIVNANVEIIEDVTLKKNQCIIETEGGIFDCSLGVELKELKKQLLLLSYDGVQRS